MGTKPNTRITEEKVTKPKRCSLCKQPYTPMCDYMQGRCPHHPSMVDRILSNPHKSRFYNLIKFFKGKK